jgi:hypothetical protein
MQAFKVFYKGKLYVGTEFLSHGEGGVLELLRNDGENILSILVAPAVLCEIGRVNVETSEETEASPDESSTASDQGQDS